MRKLDIWSSIFWIILSASIGVHSLRLGLGSLFKPGPGFLFFWSSILLGTLSIILLVSAIAAKREHPTGVEEKVFENVNWIKIMSVVLCLVIYATIIEWLGFLISTILLIASLLRSIEAKKWPLVIFVALVSTFLAYGLFELLLHTRLPKGILRAL